MNSGLLDKKLDYWEHQLLDLGKRNKMINYRETKRTTIKLIEPSFDELFKRIALNEETLTFQRAIDRETDIRVFSILSLLEHLSSSLPVTIGDIKTEGNILERQRTLKNLRAKARLAQEEQGTNILYLSFGFIEWKDGKGSSAQWIKSPLILVPATLALEALNAPYTLKKHEDDIVVNPTLEYYLKTEYGIELPQFDPDKDALDGYLTALEEIADKRGWRILREASLGLLSFLKISMYHDLLRNKERIKKNPVIRAMAGDTADANAIPAQLQGFDLDSISAKDSFQVMSADSSQQDAILYSKNNISFVMQGPPGTGKSQTITNIIAEALAEGKKVLFVSEKMAALQVVYRRLLDANLGDFCLPLHSYKANKKEILEQIGANLKLMPTRVKDTAMTSLEELSAIRRELNGYAQELHRLNPELNISCYEAYSKFEELRDAPTVSLTLANPLSVSQSELQASLNALKEYSLAVKRLDRFIKNNPWNSLTSRNSSYEYSERMQSELSTLSTSLSEALGTLELLTECPKLAKTCSFIKLKELSNTLYKIGNLPTIPSAWMYGFDFNSAIVNANEAQRLYSELALLRDEIAKTFNNSIYAYDYSEWKKTLSSVANRFVGMPFIAERSVDYYINNAPILLSIFCCLKEKLSEAERSFSSINALLGTSFTANAHNLQTISEMFMLIQGNDVIVETWFGSDLQKIKTLVNTAKSKSEAIAACRERLLSVWEPDVFSLDYMPILTRYKTDYTGILKVFNPQYHQDKKRIQALAKTVIKKLSDDVAINLLLNLKDYHESLAWFESSKAELQTSLSSYYLGTDSEWDKILTALSITEKLKSLSFTSIPSKIIEILSADHKSQIDSLQVLLAEAVQTFADIRTLATHNKLTLNVDSPDFNAVNAISSAEFYITNFNEMLAKTELIRPYLVNRNEQLPGVLTALEKMISYKSVLSSVELLSPKLKKQLGDLFVNESTDWNGVVELLEKASDIAKSPHADVAAPLVKASPDRKKTLLQIADKLNRIHEAGQVSLNWLSRQFAESEEFSNRELLPLLKRVEEMLANIGILGKWIDYQEAKNTCESLELSEFITQLEQKEIFDDIERAFLKAFYCTWLGAVCDRSDSVRRFRRSSHDARIESFVELDDRQLTIAQARIRQRLIENLPTENRLLKATDEVSILNKELNKKRSIMPLRKLFRQIPNLLLRLKPCLMMSPLSVSYFLETEAYHFDLVIFDEASQIFPEDAIGAIFRGSQVIIAGDSKQLPPTNFFASTTNNFDGEYDIGDDDDMEEIVSDSILEEAAAVLPNRTLLWHYRSKHESLIAFSNREIYKNNLITFPNSITKVADMGVEYIYIKDGVYDRGGKKNNIREAEECVRLVFEHIEKHPERSLGIIAFSESQQTTIENAIIDYRERNPAFEWFFDESRDEPFFIKNLENVQGDERDTIIFSICYGKDRNGAMYMNFGPVGHSGGERRLNVAITRAKCNVKLVGSILPSDIDEKRAKSEGARMLRAYIEYAMKGVNVLKPSSNASALESEDDFCDIIASFLEQNGYKIERRVGCSDYKIDIAIIDPKSDGEYVAGIECDGLSYIHAKTARDRDHLRKSVLTNMGWNLYRVWSTEWSRNPEAEGKALIRFIQSVYDKSGNVVHAVKQSNSASSCVSIDEVSTETTPKTSLASQDNPYGFGYYHETNVETAFTMTQAKLCNAILRVVTAEQPIHTELLYKRLCPLFSAGKVTETIKSSVNRVLRGELNTKLRIDKDGFIRLLPLTAISVRIPDKNAVPRPFEYIHTEEVALAMIEIIKLSFGITTEDLASECARVFGFERKGAKIKVKTDAAINWLTANKKIRIIDGKVQLTGD